MRTLVIEGPQSMIFFSFVFPWSRTEAIQRIVRAFTAVKHDLSCKCIEYVLRNLLSFPSWLLIHPLETHSASKRPFSQYQMNRTNEY